MPKALRPFILTKTGKQRTEWLISLKTKDKRTAEQRCHVEAVRTDFEIAKAQKVFEALLAEQALSPAEREARRAHVDAQRFKQDMEQARFEAELEAAGLVARDQAGEDFEFENREQHRQALLVHLNKPRRELAPAEAAMRDLIPDEEFDPPEVKEVREGQRRQEWDAGAREFGLAFAAQRSGSVSSQYPALMAIFDAYAAEAGLEPATRKRWEPCLRSLIAHVGHDDASKLQRSDLVEWKDFLLNEADAAGKTVRGPKTVREVYVAAIKATLAWALDNGRIEHSPASTIRVRVPKKVRLRDPDFTENEGKLILRASLLAPTGRISAEHALARRWVPWICAYTGARVNEITQLRAEDVMIVGGVWTLRITPEAGSQKSRTARVVPLHSHLVDLGFPGIAKAKGKGPLFYDPARGRGGSAANPHYKKVGERLASWVRSIGVDDPDVQPNHAWRHLFKSRARTAGMDIDAREAIPGHDPGTEGRRYGVNDVSFLAREIEKLPRFHVED